MKIGIVAAMEEEKRLLEERMSIHERRNVAGWEFISGTLFGKSIVLIQSGIGKVMSAISTTLLIEEFHCDLIVNTGSAGGLHPSLKIGDIVVATELAYNDVDVTGFQYAFGQLPGMPERFAVEGTLVEKVQEAGRRNQLPVYSGLIVSGDIFVHTEEPRKAILQNFPDVWANEMEGASIAQTCYTFGVPCIVIRAISDIPSKGSSAIDFDQFIIEAGKASAELVSAVLPLL